MKEKCREYVLESAKKRDSAKPTKCVLLEWLRRNARIEIARHESDQTPLQLGFDVISQQNGRVGVELRSRGSK